MPRRVALSSLAVILITLALAVACVASDNVQASKHETSHQVPSSAPNHQQDSSATIAANQNNNNNTTGKAPAAGTDCPTVCTNAEYLTILNKISLNVDIIRDFQRNESSTTQTKYKQQQQQQQIRPECVRQLIQMIKNLASGELEMKTLLEFASSTSKINLRSDLNYLRASYASDKHRDLETRRRREQQSASSGCQQQQLALEAESRREHDYYLLGDEPSAQAADVEKVQFLPKLVASIDQWLDTIERFTMTREWTALMRVSYGAESIMNLFANSTSTTRASSATSAVPASASGKSSSKAQLQLATVQKATGLSDELLEVLERELPSQVQTLTSSLNQLFPWHVWPWNNIDLYSTIDTFLNHGIFAFSKTTSGPERRIDYLPQMLEALFKSLKYDAFPKKCNDWSRMICDLELFHDRLVLAAADGEAGSNSTEELAKRKQQLTELMRDNKNKLTQELVCIMFSSLSMQQFGAKDVDLKSFEHELDSEQAPGAQSQASLAPSTNQLKWKRQIRKALKLYKLSREALTDEQWAALYKQLNDLWNQMKISDRVIMVGRIVQLLTNCHMPREILESALWKDIYKYKNALNQISDIVIEELNRSSESGKFSIEQLAIGSKHLEDILTRFIRLLPRLIESLSLTTTDQLPELVSKFFDEKIAFFKGPCKGHSFSELVPSLSKYRAEIVELERLVCQQLRTKPSIVMSQFNNLTNEFLAMALNFTTLGGSLQSLPRFWTGASQSQVESAARPMGAAASVQAVSAAGAALVASTKQNLNTLMSSMNVPPEASLAAETAGNVDLSRREDTTFDMESSKQTANGTSIIDELAANPRLAQIVAILQSSALDPPEVHAELPELDWVEAGTSVALLYETIQKLLSFEGAFVIFPEVAEFQEEMQLRLESSKRMFTKFGKKDPANLVAYSFDTVMPVALRTFQPLDSFHSECLSTFRDIFGETDFVENSLAASSGLANHAAGQPASAMASTSRESRQWQCAISATNFASFALNNLVGTFNSMLKNILKQMSRQRDLYKFKQTPLDSSEMVGSGGGGSNNGNSSATSNATCVLFDGSITTLMDNLPQLLDLSLETILIASTTTKQQLTLKDAMCSFENTLDPLAEQQQLQKQFKLREAVCHLLHESSLSTCADALKVDLWTSTMKELNSTWFELAAISVEPSFRGILKGVHEFLELFGKVKPSSMSDGLIARVLNFNSYWAGLMNKAVSSLENYREKRFQLTLQILMPIIYDNLPVYNEGTHSTMEETKLALKTSILSARSILNYLTKAESGEGSAAVASSQPPTDSPSARVQDQVDQQLRTLFDWADRHSIVISETLIRTVAHNLTKFERLFNSTDGSNNSANQTWTRFCLAPVDTYLEFEETAPLENKASLPLQTKLAEMSTAKETICKFEWALLQAHLFQQANLSATIQPNSALVAVQNASSTSIDQYSTRQLIRVSLTKWGQVLDLVFPAVSGGNSAPGSRKAAALPKFLSLSHWQSLQEKLPQLTPTSYEPTNFIWIWQALERIVNTIDQANRHHYNLVLESPAPNVTTTVVERQSQGNSSSTSSAEALTKIFDQFNCALDVVKGGISWDNMVNIYQDRQDVLAAHATLNNGIALASASANTFLAHKKFQKFLNSFVKPRAGLSAFCDMRDKSRLETIFLSPSTSAGLERIDEDLANAIESFQEFVCDTNLETFVQNINPISICYQQQVLAPAQKVGSNSSLPTVTTISPPPVEQRQPQQAGQLADTIDRFFKLASLAALDAKLVDTNDAKPPIFDKSQWEQLRAWWLNQTEVHQGNSGLALTLVRVFQTLDSINSEHVVWRAIFRSVHELSEVSAYLVRAAEMERQATLEQRERGQPTKLALIREAAAEVDSALKDTAKNSTQPSLKFGHKQQQLASTMANVMFPEVSNFISLKTFKQLRYIKSISEYFASAPGAQESLCKNLTAKATDATRLAARSALNSNTGPVAIDLSSDESDDDAFSSTGGVAKRSKFELIDYKLNTSKRLFSLLCHYHSSQWLTAMNIVLSSKTSSLSKKVNYMTKYLLIFTKNFQHNANLQSFIHGQQLENIEAVANTTVSQLVALTQPFRTLTLTKISNISWHSIPTLLDSIDHRLCASKNEQQQANTASGGLGNQQHQQQPYQLAVYEPKKPDIETLICKLPSWNITQVYNYISENIDLQNMISLATQNNNTTTIFGLTTSPATNRTSSAAAKQPRTCITPFKFASRWLKIAQELIDETMSKSSRDKIRKCLNSNKKGQSLYVQTLRYVKILNSFLSTINDLAINNSWPIVRRTWNSISFAILNQTGQLQQTLPTSHTATLAAPPPPVTPVTPLF